MYIQKSALLYAAPLCFALSALAANRGASCDPPLVWTVYHSYTDPGTSLIRQSMITGDGSVTASDGSGNIGTVYSNNGSAVIARLNTCGTSPSFDATLLLGTNRSFSLNLASALGNSYATNPPSSYLAGTLLNVEDIMWCQHNGYASSGCTFYTRLTSAETGPDRNTYHFRMESTNPNIVPDSYTLDSTANCPYANSPVQVVFTPAALSGTGKDTYVVTPVLQGTNTGSGWAAPAPNGACGGSGALPAGTWPAAVGVLIQGTSGNSTNFGQYGVPFKFVIQNQ